MNPPFISLLGCPKLKELNLCGVVLFPQYTIYPSLTKLELNYIPANVLTQNMVIRLQSDPQLSIGLVDLPAYA